MHKEMWRHKIEDKGLKQPMVNNILWYMIHISIQRKTEPNQHQLLWAYSQHEFQFILMDNNFYLNLWFLLKSLVFT